jgi:hypothetical protein
MVTTNIASSYPFTGKFTVDVAYGNTGSIYVRAEREDGQERAYYIPEKKLRIFAALDTTLKDAVEFLLGENHA